MDIMYNKKLNTQVEVYAFDVDHGVALFYDPRIARGNGGNGWQKCPIKQIVPVEYVTSNGEYISKTERNKVKSRLKLVDAIWECEDGKRFNHQNIEDAIEYQRELMKEDK